MTSRVLLYDVDEVLTVVEPTYLIRKRPGTLVGGWEVAGLSVQRASYAQASLSSETRAGIVSPRMVLFCRLCTAVALAVFA